MCSNANGAKPIGSYALVTYIPDPLGSFLNRLRQELIAGCALHAHVSVLPPRPLRKTQDEAMDQIREWASQTEPVTIQLGDVNVFEKTSVVYIEVARGFEELRAMHRALNRNSFLFEEKYEYHPHVTLAQDFPAEQVSAMKQLAERRWAECPYRKSFQLDHVTFVRNTDENLWFDIEDCPLLGAHSAVKV
jgi:hypothetical protein